MHLLDSRPRSQEEPPVFETIEIIRQGAVAELWLNRPDKLNPLSKPRLNRRC